ncbi:MAG: selenide, water dikinase SelD [Candidatus Puniceispirillaceae bacterium]
MKHNAFHPKQLHLVLVGGGHAHVQVLKSLAMKPIDGLAITLITDVLDAPYSGMLPGFVEGVWDKSDIHIDLTRLASFAGATLIHEAVTGINADDNLLFVTNRPPVGYDILSLNCGAVPDLSSIKGAETASIAVKPIAHFIEKLPDTIPAGQRINIIGAGVAGLELSFAFKVKYKPQNPDIHIFSRSKTLLPKSGKSASRKITKLANAAGMTLHQDVAITQITDRFLSAEDGQTYQSGVNFVVTGVRPSAFIASLDKGRDQSGFVIVKPTLQSVAYDNIFAAGDIASIASAPREKAGVFAVRAGQILADNLRRYIFAQPLRDWRPQKEYLAIIGTGDGKALAIRNGASFHHKWCWQLKKRIDKAFMDKFSELPGMKMPAPAPLPRYLADGQNRHDAIFADMRCAGCAAKASASLLQGAMTDAIEAAKNLGIEDSYLAQASNIAEDASQTQHGDNILCHSIDSLNQMIADPFLFGQIAVNHALSDLYVAGADPVYAQAHMTLEEAAETHQKSVATHLLSGSLVALAGAKARLIGGHTSQAPTPSLGFAVTGIQRRQFSDYQTDKDYVLVMTKRLGTGMALAAHMRQSYPSYAYQVLVETMLLSNQKAAEAMFAAGAIAMTDITGFGLARHCQNVITRFDNQFGITINLSSLPLLPAIEDICRSDLRSSAHENNKRASSIIMTNEACSDWRQAMLFDPQTSGGVLALIPADKADTCMSEITAREPQSCPCVIGHVVKDNKAIIIES